MDEGYIEAVFAGFLQGLSERRQTMTDGNQLTSYSVGFLDGQEDAANHLKRVFIEAAVKRQGE